MATQWYFRNSSEEFGPVPFLKLIELVQAGELDEADQVRPAWNPTWQRADSVVGLMHMAERKPEDLEQLKVPAVPEAAEIQAAQAALPIAESIDEMADRPGWMKRLLQVGGIEKWRLRPAATPILGTSAPDPAATPAAGVAASRAHAASESPASQSPDRNRAAARLAGDPLPAELAGCGAAPTAGSSWSNVVDQALAAVDARHSGNQPAKWRSRWPRMSRFIPGERLDRSKMRIGFRLATAMICGIVAALAIDDWSRQEALRFPRAARVAGTESSARRFPLIGECGTGEYQFLLVDLMLISGAAAWFGAGWIASRAED